MMMRTGRKTDDAPRAGTAAPARAEGGAGRTLRWAMVGAPFGDVLVAATDAGVCRVRIDRAPATLAEDFPDARLVAGDAELTGWAEAIVASVTEPRVAAHVPRDVAGTEFQDAVWRALAAIPPGETRSYADIAAGLGRPGATRAVGSACGANRLALLVPCHRAVRSDGSLGGFAWGLAVKERLLAMEREASARTRAGPVPETPAG